MCLSPPSGVRNMFLRCFFPVDASITTMNFNRNHADLNLLQVSIAAHQCISKQYTVCTLLVHKT